ncbi:hypothetical protein OQA88_3459 [Cercophora sp. LCS_1]
MAVFEGIEGLSVRIKINGQKAKEHVPPHDSNDCGVPDNLQFHYPFGPTASPPYTVRYIESVPNALFEIYVHRKRAFVHADHHIAFSLVFGSSGFCLKQDHRRGPSWRGTVAAVHSRDPKGQIKEHSLQFAPLQVGKSGPRPPAYPFIPDDTTDFPLDVIREQISLASNLGLIRVVFHHMKCAPMRPWTSTAPEPQNDNVCIGEKALKGKALDTRVKYGSKVANGWIRPELMDPVFADPEARPFAVVDFRYRTMDGLRKEGIVARPSTPDQIDEMSEAEVRRLARELLISKRNEEITRIKSENGEGSAVKRERASTMSDAEFLRKYKGRRIDDGRVEVDLTDD